MELKQFAPTPFVVLLAGLGLAGAQPASAAIIDGLSSFASAKVFANTPVTQGPITTTPTASASAFTSGTDASGNTSDAFGRAFGNVSGVYGVGADGNGVFDATGHFIRTWNITNDSLSALAYSFNFYIYGGSMGANAFGATGSGFAEYILKITWGGNLLFHSEARANSDGTCTQTGTPLDGASCANGFYSWFGTTVGLNLGVLNPGESRLLQYDLIGHAFGDYNFDGPGDEFGGCGYGYGQLTGIGFSTDFEVVLPGCTGSSRVFMGDPSGVDATPVLGPPHVTSQQASGVPEPGSLALLGTGLLVAFSLRWRMRTG